ncbi:MAG: hypothetical protein OEM20_00310 [Gammaproteobacteria bacterium]|nr:hypothetical protein [Gammaproteobacteria bacterium]MDH3576459.1 hypothetical protein [Gammaproteobacteria bacterium]
MFTRTTARRKPGSLKRRVLGLLAVLWLNTALLPCAMAFESSQNCPHCPPVEEQQMASHHGHGEVDAKPSCATAQLECCDLAAASIDTRGSNLQFKPTSDVVFIAAPVAANLPARESVQQRVASDPPDISGTSPPLHVLYCVYLK